MLCHIATLVPLHCSFVIFSSFPSLPSTFFGFILCSFLFLLPLSCPSFTSLVPHITYIPFSFFLYISSFHSFLLTFFSSFLLFLHFPLFLFSFSSPSYIYISELNLADFITSPICECLLAPFQSCYSEAKCLFLVWPLLSHPRFPLLSPFYASSPALSPSPFTAYLAIYLSLLQYLQEWTLTTCRCPSLGWKFDCPNPTRGLRRFPWRRGRPDQHRLLYSPSIYTDPPTHTAHTSPKHSQAHPNTLHAPATHRPGAFCVHEHQRNSQLPWSCRLPGHTNTFPRYCFYVQRFSTWTVFVGTCDSHCT